MANIPCERCGGSGKLRNAYGRLMHVCGRCKGAGWQPEPIEAGPPYQDPRTVKYPSSFDLTASLFDDPAKEEGDE